MTLYHSITREKRLTSQLAAHVSGLYLSVRLVSFCHLLSCKLLVGTVLSNFHQLLSMVSDFHLYISVLLYIICYLLYLPLRVSTTGAFHCIIILCLFIAGGPGILDFFAVTILIIKLHYPGPYKSMMAFLVTFS